MLLFPSQTKWWWKSLKSPPRTWEYGSSLIRDIIMHRYHMTERETGKKYLSSHFFVTRIYTLKVGPAMTSTSGLFLSFFFIFFGREYFLDGFYIPLKFGVEQWLLGKWNCDSTDILEWSWVTYTHVLHCLYVPRSCWVMWDRGKMNIPCVPLYQREPRNQGRQTFKPKNPRIMKFNGPWVIEPPWGKILSHL